MPTSPGNTLRSMEVFHGLAINYGTVLAPACLYSAERHKTVIETRLRSADEAARELRRLRQAVADCGTELDRIVLDTERSIGKTEAEIFITQKHIMNDTAITGRIHDAVATDMQNVEYAVHRVFSEYEEQFKQIDNHYLRERASDIGEVRIRLLDKLHGTRPGFICEGQMHCNRGRNRVIAAEELTPDMILHMDLEKVKGFVTEHGGISSHAAVIARSLGIPAVSGITGLLDSIRCGDRVLIDGDTGTVCLNPTEERIAALGPRHRSDEDVRVLNTPEGMEVMANASLFEDVKMARAVHADGIGLFRTEMLFLRESRLLSEDEQHDLYSRIATMMEGKPVVFRLLDVGGDKPLPFLRVEQETNPYLGWRGARFLLGNPDILAMQLRALARVSRDYPLRIMIPMVIDAAQTTRLLSLIGGILEPLGMTREQMRIGAMFEVPSAIFDAAAIFDQVDFGSIGSNDLIQYTFAIDRNNERVSGDYNPEHPILWNMLDTLSASARIKRKTLSICGEMAAREGIPTRLRRSGIRSLSVSPRLIGRVRSELIEAIADAPAA